METLALTGLSLLKSAEHYRQLFNINLQPVLQRLFLSNQQWTSCLTFIAPVSVHQ